VSESIVQLLKFLGTRRLAYETFHSH